MNISYWFLAPMHVTPQLARDVEKLLHQLDPKITLTIEHLRQVAAASRFLVAYYDSELVGIGCLMPIITVTRRRGIIDHVVVTEKMRRNRIGTGIMRELIGEAYRLNLTRLDLTSRAEKDAAQHLYLKLGFKMRETCNFRFELV